MKKCRNDSTKRNKKILYTRSLKEALKGYQKNNEAFVWTCNGADNAKIKDVILEWYGYMFAEYLNEKNQKNISEGRKGRVRTMEDICTLPLTSPEFLIIELGKC